MSRPQNAAGSSASLNRVGGMCRRFITSFKSHFKLGEHSSDSSTPKVADQAIFQEELDYVAEKNEELYERLA
jgi:hypothetical protein